MFEISIFQMDNTKKHFSMFLRRFQGELSLFCLPQQFQYHTFFFLAYLPNSKLLTLVPRSTQINHLHTYPRLRLYYKKCQSKTKPIHKTQEMIIQPLLEYFYPIHLSSKQMFQENIKADVPSKSLQKCSLLQVEKIYKYLLNE